MSKPNLKSAKKPVLTENLSIDLKQSENFVKPTLLCRTGIFDGLYGQVKVNKERLEALAARYKEIRSTPANENDYAPILLDHNRSVELVMGRLLPEGLEVREWREVDGEMQFGLYGNLRVDDEAARKKVESGKYAHVSISYDEETNEIQEVSFVAVEAARGSIVLKQGEKQMSTELESKHSRLTQRHKALAAVVKGARATRKAALSQLVAKKSEIEKELSAALAKANEAGSAIKTGQIKARLASFVRQGKMSPVELKKIDVKGLVALNESALKYVLDSYESRAVSTDALVFGQSNDQVPSVEPKDKEAMRRAMAAQKKGVALSDEDKKKLADEDDEDGEKKKLAEADKEVKSYAMDEEAYSKCMADVTDVHSKLSGVMDHLKKMAEAVDEMAESEDEQEKKEMAAEEADKEGDEK